MFPLLIAQHAPETSNFLLERLLEPEVLVFVVAIVAVLAGVLVKVTNSIIGHRERIEKIRQGIDPDADRTSTH